jgi:hypothetical protein
MSSTPKFVRLAFAAALLGGCGHEEGRVNDITRDAECKNDRIDMMVTAPGSSGLILHEVVSKDPGLTQKLRAAMDKDREVGVETAWTPGKCGGMVVTKIKP